MPDTLLKLHGFILNLAENEEGQDLVEYGLLCAALALTCVAGMQNVATAISSLFATISGVLV